MLRYIMRGFTKVVSINIAIHSMKETDTMVIHEQITNKEVCQLFKWILLSVEHKNQMLEATLSQNRENESRY